MLLTLTLRIWLVWKFPKQHRKLDVYEVNSTSYRKLGAIASELEEVWEVPHPLTSHEVIVICCPRLYYFILTSKCFATLVDRRTKFLWH